MNGQLGYTCSGVAVAVGYNARNTYFSYAVSRCASRGAMFVKCAYDMDKKKFNEEAAQLYRKEYFSICQSLPSPAFAVCADISVNSGPGRSRQFMNELGRVGSDVKGYATRLNQLHRDFYKRIVRPGTSNHKFDPCWMVETCRSL